MLFIISFSQMPRITQAEGMSIISGSGSQQGCVYNLAHYCTFEVYVQK